MKEQIIKLIEKMADTELKQYENKGEYGPLKYKSRTSAVKHHRKAVIYARIIANIKKL